MGSKLLIQVRTTVLGSKHEVKLSSMNQRMLAIHDPHYKATPDKFPVSRPPPAPVLLSAI